MTWFDRSASPARRWWDRVARRRARRGSKIPEDDRSFFGPVWLYLRSRGRMLMAAATAVKAARGITCYRERSCFAEPAIGRRFAPTRWPRSQNNRFAVASREIALVFRGAVGRIGLAAT